MTPQTGLLFLLLLGAGAALVCPDGGVCEDRSTCCKNIQGGYGCCPLPHAECCSDHLHCCYEGTLCDLVHEKCVNKTVSLPWMRRLPSTETPLLPLERKLKAIVCPDQESECPDDTTCCQLPDGQWGCCPFPKAVCCEDKRHCCPENTTCDLLHSKCAPPSLQFLPMREKVPARAPAASSVTCPGGKSSCPNSSTCCLLTTGDYGCCPYPQATCCSDRLHCCPGNTTCDLERGVCKSDRAPALPVVGGSGSELERPLRSTEPDRLGSSHTSDLSSVTCSDKKSVCPDETTCCQLTNGTYGCCPLPDAVCCSDHLHCCPTGTSCDLARQTCESAGGVKQEVTALVELQEAPKRAHAVVCNGSSICPDGNTCCKSSSEGWACCPLPEAVCCEDHLHCCPHGTVCNLPASTCDDLSGTAVTPLLANTPVLSELTGSSRRAEPAGAGKTESVEENLPPTLSGTLTPHTRLAASSPSARAENKCDAQTSCPPDTTCCFMKLTSSWGCCPLPQAVCCEDGDHCCPREHICLPHRSSCSRGPHLLPWFTKVSARTQPGAVGDIKCDDKSRCASGTTCCRLPSGEWGCCPLVKAVCCDDHEHCCPQGYTCHMQTGTCEKKDADDAGVPCDGAGTFRCPKQHTCCRSWATEWGCCPAANAVCCPDSGLCCPPGHSCNPKTGSCSRPTHLSWDTLLQDRERL